MKLLFESIKTIYKTGKIYPVQQKPVLAEDHAIIADCFIDATGATVGTVLKDGGRYRMWYQAWPQDYTGEDVCLVAYAESDNGIDWIKPELNSVEYSGSTTNNICNIGMHSPSVYIDPSAIRTYRYRATGYARPKRIGVNNDISEEGYYSLHSEDGLNWEVDSTSPTWAGGDVIKSIYHPYQDRAIIAMKYFLRVNDIHRRSIYTSEGKDGAWSEPVSALVPDDFDDICARQNGYCSSDYYGMGMMPVGNGTVGFLWQFRHTLPLKTSLEYSLSNYASDGVVDISLVFQPKPGERWLHQPGRKNFISHNDDGTSRSVYSASCPVEVGDEQWLYYSSTPLEHVGFDIDLLKKYGIGSIKIAKWKKNRLFGFQAVPEGAIEVNIGRIDKPFKVKLNAKTDMEGYIKAYLYGSKLKSSTCVKDEEKLLSTANIKGDIIDQTIEWADGKTILDGGYGSEMILRLEAKCATLYAYDILMI